MKSFIRNKKRFKWAVAVLSIFVLVAFFSPFLANDHAIVCKDQNGWSFFTQKVGINGFCIQPVIPYSPQQTDVERYFSTSPLSEQPTLSWRNRHWLGTDKLGRDVAAGMIHGTKVGLLIGFISITLAFIFGVSLGMVSAYNKDNGIKFHFIQVIFGVISIFIIGFYGYYQWQLESFGWWILITYLVILIFSNILLNIIIKKFGWPQNVNFPIDTLLVKAIEVRKSFPGLFILLALTSLVTSPSVWSIIVIISLLIWPDFARYARAETLAVAEENYVVSAKVLGLGHWKILYRHILPNILPTLTVVACFSISGALILESSLSFLGLGLPVEQVTWGKMMAEGRNMYAWWLVVFPGIALFLIVLGLNTIAEEINDHQKSFSLDD